MVLAIVYVAALPAAITAAWIRGTGSRILAAAALLTALAAIPAAREPEPRTRSG